MSKSTAASGALGVAVAAGLAVAAPYAAKWAARRLVAGAIKRPVKALDPRGG